MISFLKISLYIWVILIPTINNVSVRVDQDINKRITKIWRKFDKIETSIKLEERVKDKYSEDNLTILIEN